MLTKSNVSPGFINLKKTLQSFPPSFGSVCFHCKKHIKQYAVSQAAPQGAV